MTDKNHEIEIYLRIMPIMTDLAMISWSKNKHEPKALMC